MSAFIVEDETINRIVTWAETNARKIRGTLSEFKIGEIEMTKQGFIAEAKLSEQDLQKMANSFLLLNKLGVDSRYDEKKELHPMKFRREFAPDIQVLKSMHCLRYQCDEGENNKQPGFKLLEELIQILTDSIINSLPEYEKAVWG